MKKLSTFGILALMLLCISSLSAFTFSPNRAHASTSSQSHCVQQLAPLRRGQKTSDVLSFHCYSTFAEATAAATGGRVHLASNASAAQVRAAINASNTAVSPNDTYTLSIEYWDWAYQGATLTLTGSFPCNPFVTYGVSYVGDTFNDEISSSMGFNACNHVIHWQDANYGGASLDCNSSCYAIQGAMNDQTSSIQLNEF